jgi:hypothetical protein
MQKRYRGHLGFLSGFVILVTVVESKIRSRQECLDGKLLQDSDRKHGVICVQ